VKFYEEAEGVLARLTRLGTPMILYEIEPGTAKKFGMSTMQHKVQRIRKELNLDECADPGECEYIELPNGGVMWAHPAVAVPLDTARQDTDGDAPIQNLRG
jgi:hypothetical protein